MSFVVLTPAQIRKADRAFATASKALATIGVILKASPDAVPARKPGRPRKTAVVKRGPGRPKAEAKVDAKPAAKDPVLA